MENLLSKMTKLWVTFPKIFRVLYLIFGVLIVCQHNFLKRKIIENTAFPNTPKDGTYFRYVQIPPDKDLGIITIVGQPHPLPYQTATLDYIVILSGEIYLIMDEEETQVLQWC